MRQLRSGSVKFGVAQFYGRTVETLDFTLTYEGPLPSGQGDHRRQGKNMLRVVFHRQLEHLCETHWELGLATKGKLPVATLRGENLGVPGTMPDGLFIVQRGGYDFVPLFSQTRPFLIKVRIEIYRTQWRGRVFNPGGDLDNQAKVVLDGLRVPQDDIEARGLDLPTGARCYSLLENDALITAVTIESRQSLRTEAPDYANLMVHVEATLARFL
jgi:hypothetical protein